MNKRMFCRVKIPKIISPSFCSDECPISKYGMEKDISTCRKATIEVLRMLGELNIDIISVGNFDCKKRIIMVKNIACKNMVKNKI